LGKLKYRCETAISICQRVISDNEAAINNEKKEAQQNQEDASAKELENMRKKLEADVSASANAGEEDEFWNGSEEKSSNTSSADDFWNGGEDPNATVEGKDNFSGIEIGVDYKNKLLSLKHPDGTIIKEWSGADYSSIEKIDEGAHFFKLQNQINGTGPLSRNYYSIVDKGGNPVHVDGHESFAAISPREEGGFTLRINTSESHYHD